MDNIYQFSAEKLRGGSVPLADYQGKVLLVVNTASKCGLTPQYKGLQALYDKYEEKGLVVLGFPCNQFASQEPGDADAIAQTCSINYGVTFPMFAKTNVNGNDAHPLFVYLKKKLPGFLGSAVKWNFTKFLIDRNGIPFKRYAPTTAPEKLETDILELLNMQAGQA